MHTLYYFKFNFLITLYFILLQISCIYQASLLPLKQIINNNNNYEERELRSYYYPSSSQRANEVHDLTLSDVDESVGRLLSEMMESSASNYYRDEDYSMGASEILHENFESEKIKQSDIKLAANRSNLSEEIVDDGKNKPNIAQQQVPNLDDSKSSSSSSSSLKSTNDNSNKFSKLLFSSPSATVSTSNGPSVSNHI